ncbi:hypothetical protein AX17_001535 [Amanita inopinata Kibby_2008]|nr:hypothetical protein AX17_001535 [Amanita inopinata Kibby_2008]
MESTEELQQLEIMALRSIYDEDFIDCPPPKAWKGATRLPEFIIRVPHPDFAHAHKISLHLHVKFPKTYPTLAYPIFNIEKPIQGITNDQVSKLSHAITVEAQKCKGSEMVFQIVNFIQDWIMNNVKPPVEVVGSLALQMNQRAMDAERARKQREAEEAEREQERAAREAEALQAQIKEDAMRQLLAREEYRARRRANSEATEVPVAGDTPTETFANEVEIGRLRFNTVKLFHPRNEGLGTVYLAEPICDDVNTTFPLELFVVTFNSHYYTTTQGRKKIKRVEADIQRLTSIRHPNLLSVFAVKLHLPHSSGPPQLMVLSEQAPALTLHDVLEDCESLKEERATDYLGQILAALNAVHAGGLMHRGINTRCIGLVSRDHPTQSKQIKLGKVCYHTRLLDLHRSNEFGSFPIINVEETHIPDAWLSRDIQNESSLHYSRHRDIHAVGILLLQMLLGLDVTERFSDVHEALLSSPVSSTLAQHALNMIEPPKKNNITCLTLLADLAEGSRHSQLKSAPIAISDPAKTPRLPPPSNYGTSPDNDYFRTPMRPRQASRWKEDWEELELLGKGAYGSVVKARNKIDGRIYAVKKIRLRTMQKDTKIFREVNALSRLSHRFIVRYYTTWVETSEAPPSTVASDDSGIESGTEDGLTSVPGSSERHLPRNGGFSIDLNDLDEISGSHSQSSFPSIHFSRSKSPGTSGESSSGGDGDRSGSGSGSGSSLGGDGQLKRLFGNGSGTSRFGQMVVPPPFMSRTLYIQMEFVERQTLKERVAEGISEDEAWRLFQQTLDALVHMSTLGILHRDIKLTNIFIGE